MSPQEARTLADKLHKTMSNSTPQAFLEMCCQAGACVCKYRALVRLAGMGPCPPQQPSRGAHACAHAHLHAHAPTTAPMHTHAHAQLARACPCACPRARPGARARAWHVHAHSKAYAQAHAHANKHSRAHAHAHACGRNARTHTCKHTHAHDHAVASSNGRHSYGVAHTDLVFSISDRRTSRSFDRQPAGKAPIHSKPVMPTHRKTLQSSWHARPPTAETRRPSYGSSVCCQRTEIACRWHRFLTRANACASGRTGANLTDTAAMIMASRGEPESVEGLWAGPRSTWGCTK